jgi:chromosome segregation ATPase
VTQNESDISQLQTDTQGIDARVTQNESDISQLQTDTQGIDARVTQNESDISQLQTDTQSLDTRTTDLENRHEFQDNDTGKTYKYGFKQENGFVVFMYEEVI